MCLKLTLDGNPIILATGQIACVRWRGHSQGARIFMCYGDYFDVAETFDEVAAMLGKGLISAR